jgi:hypothetical protein
MYWEEVGKVDSINTVYRAEVPGGWLVIVTQPDGVGITFYPDPDYEWR